MKGLLDTHTFIWWDSQPSRLSPAALAFLQNRGHQLLISVVSTWEIILKARTSKLTLRAPLVNVVKDQMANGFQVLPVTLDHVLALESLPTIHKDPFDRLLIAQAGVEGAVLGSADAVFAQYPVTVLW
jgi:PIN domain nuclease of toxin-antitoxin system